MHECLFSGNVVRQEYSICTSIKDSSNRFKAFLASRVPNLRLDDLVVQLNLQVAKFQSDGDLMVVAELVTREAVQQAGLSHGRVPDNDHFKLHVGLVHGPVGDD